MNKRAIKQAVELYANFREKQPRKLDVIDFEVPDAVAVIGYVEELTYRTTHGKTSILYEHPFSAGSRPLLCVSSDGRQLILLGGRFKFTDRGIVDRDVRGREIENVSHGEIID
jgi:hypothetical protein